MDSDAVALRIFSDICVCAEKLVILHANSAGSRPAETE